MIVLAAQVGIAALNQAAWVGMLASLDSWKMNVWGRRRYIRFASPYLRTRLSAAWASRLGGVEHEAGLCRAARMHNDMEMGEY